VSQHRYSDVYRTDHTTKSTMTTMARTVIGALIKKAQTFSQKSISSIIGYDVLVRSSFWITATSPS
jgi:hypothetical protein